jgi:UMF1 family MFS transporter
MVATVILFIVANFSYEAGMPFYNALLYSVAEGRQARLVSGIGVAWGYVGSIVGMILVLPFVTGTFYGIELPLVSAGGKTGAFAPTAILFFLFALPLFVWVREKPVSRPDKPGMGAAYREVWDALRQTKKYPGVLRFLIADYFVEDAVATVILNIGLYCSIVLAMPEEQITLFLIISTCTAVLGSVAIGYLAKYWSLRHLLNLIFIGWIAALLVFAITDYMPVVWILGSVVGVLLGGLWTTTRTFLAERVPHGELGKFYGLFSLSGRAAAVLGPLIWTVTVLLFSADSSLGRRVGEWLRLDSAAMVRLPYKMAIAALALMVLVGLAVFRKVPRLQEPADGS